MAAPMEERPVAVVLWREGGRERERLGFRGAQKQTLTGARRQQGVGGTPAATGEARSRGAMDGDGHRRVPWPTPHRSPGAPSVAASASQREPAARDRPAQNDAMGGGGGVERRPQPPRSLAPGAAAALSASRERGSEEERD